MRYNFTGWGDDPLELFDAGRFGECLHATLQAYSVIDHPTLTHNAVTDTGLLHELAHLATGVPINLHNSQEGLRVELIGVLALVDAALAAKC